MNIIIVVWN